MNISETSMYFGMSEDLILGCINSGQIKGAVQDENGEWDIPETAIFYGTGGGSGTVKEIVEEAEEKFKRSMAPVEQQINALEEIISYYIEIHRSYEELFNRPNKTDLEETHLEEWHYLLRRLEELKREID